MSRKRNKNKRAEEAVPSEILAEGSGPNEVVDANPQTLAEAAEGLVEKRKGKKRRAADADAPETEPAGDDLEAVPDGEAMADVEAVGAVEVEAALEVEDAPKKKRGKRAKVKVSDDEVEAAAPVEVTEDADDSEAEPGEGEDPVAYDAAAGNAPPDATEPLSEEGEAVASVEEAMMRAEAEAELGTAELEGIEPGEDDDLGPALPTSAATMDAVQFKHLVEALVFASDKPVTIQRLRQLTRVGDVARLEQALAELAVDYQNRGIALQVVSGGYQFRTNTTYSVWVQQLIAGRPVRLSRAQLETLAIVAYRQPITRPEIDEIRGVDSSATLRLLLDRSLIRTLGKKEDVGRPMLYGTTKEFLDFFSLNDLRELPTLREYSELTAESRKVMSDRLGIDDDDPVQDPVEDFDDVEAEVSAVAAVDASATLEPAPLDDDASGDVDASAETDTTARRTGPELDVWGQPIAAFDDEEAAIDEDMSASDENVSAETSDDNEHSDADDVSMSEVSSAELSVSDESGTELSALDETTDEDVLRAAEDVSAETSGEERLSVDDGADAADLSAYDDSSSVDEVSAETSESEVSASDDASAVDELSAETSDADERVATASDDFAELGAPAGASMEERANWSAQPDDQNADERDEAPHTDDADADRDADAADELRAASDDEALDPSALDASDADERDAKSTDTDPSRD